MIKSISLRFHGRWLLPLFAAMAAVVLAISTAPQPMPPAMVRYVGPPLPDGSRVTFLHPVSTTEFLGSPNSKPTQPWIIQEVGLKDPKVISKEEAIWYRLPFAGRVPARDLGVNVKVTDVSRVYLSKHLIVSGRSERQYVHQFTDRSYGDDHVDEVDFVDAPRGLQYAFQYHSLNNSQSSEFAAHKAAIVNSFQVLPPGAQPPVP